MVPNLDSVAEFRLITNSFDAEYGRFSGAVMNAITKSGTNGLHGAAFEFLRNSDMDARAFFDPAVTVLKRNQFGYAVGGPALKNRLFWFTDYQGTRERRGTSGSLSQLPSVAQRSGTFSPERPEWRSERPLLGAGTDQASGLRRVRQRTLQHSHVRKHGSLRLPGRDDSRQRDLADLGKSAQELHPAFRTPERIRLILRAWSIAFRTTRPDSGWTSSTRRTGNWYGYYHFDDSTSTSPGIYGPAYGNFGTFTPARTQQGVIANTHTFGPSAVNEARVDFMRIASVSNQPTDPKVDLASLGFVTGPGTLGIINSGPDSLAIGAADLTHRADRLQFRPNHQRDRAVQQLLALLR